MRAVFTSSSALNHSISNNQAAAVGLAAGSGGAAGSGYGFRSGAGQLTGENLQLRENPDHIPEPSVLSLCDAVCAAAVGNARFMAWAETALFCNGALPEPA